jgi:predicted lysophospholipase L1 biosynthesis ABC-type transport system permease subunit
LAGRAAGTTPPSELISRVSAAIRGVDPQIVVLDSMSMAHYADRMGSPLRVAAWVATALGVVGLLIACLGIFAVMEHAVERRTQEIGIRLALGATRPGISRLVMGKVLATLSAGVTAGLFLAFAGTAVVGSYLYGVTPRDPLSFATAAACVLVLGAGSALMPLARALRSGPATVLRMD